MRDWIQRNSVLISMLSLIVILAVLAGRFLGGGSPKHHNSDIISDESWYFDVTTGDYVRDKMNKIPPFISPQGHELVRVVFFSCGGCNNAERFPGYYLKHTNEFKAKAEADPAIAKTLHAEAVAGRMYSLDGKTWIEASGAEAAGVIEHHRHRCDGKGTLKLCR